ncbi:MAG: TetR/AcrR family transcriptional regulator [Pseudomonadales bacterium]|nr:TetR/AcrR family transcriptional regulator [Pseudomonadales bacterium]
MNIHIAIVICQPLNSDRYIKRCFMRNKGVEKEETRKRVIDAVGRGFRKHGYSGVGVDGLAKAAGVTSGAFYAHLGSKAKAFHIAIATGLDEVIEGVPKFQQDHGDNWVNAFADYYLSTTHREDLECGCAMATLTPEAARAEAEVQAEFEKKMTTIVNLIATGLKGGSEDSRKSRAWAMLGTLIGGINMARAMKTAAASNEVANAIKSAAIAAAGPTCCVESP